LAQWSQLGLHASHLKRVQEYQSDAGQQDFARLINLVKQYTDFIVTPDDTLYPSQLLPYEDRPPIILGRVKLMPYYNRKLQLWVAANLVHMVDRWLMILLFI
jgi:DNA processing protein